MPDPLERLNQVIPWEEFRSLIEQKLFSQKQSRVGRKPFDVILMFKILILQSLYSLSDAQTEYQIHDRLTFKRFLSLYPTQIIPDEKTIWVFRERLKEACLVEELF